MKRVNLLITLALLPAAICWSGVARAQSSNPTAVQPLQLSGFGAAGGDFTGLGGGKNFDVTAGVDLGLPPVKGMRPTLEVRGTYPSDHGLIDSQKSFLGGLKVQFLLNHRLHPYADFLFGRGEMIYGGSGYLYNFYVYQLTTTNVYSPGGGFDYDFTEHLAVKVDGQFQRWASAPTPSGAIYAKVGAVGIVYNFDFTHHHIY